MALSEQQRQGIAERMDTYCNARIPPHARYLVRLSFRFGPRDVVLLEERPQLDNRSIWHEHPVAKFHHVSSADEWRLYCADQHLRWHEYRPKFVGPDFESLLAEVNEDPNGIFWG